MVNTLTRFLPMAEKIVPRRTTIGILENICIHDGIVRATNLEIHIGMEINTNVSCLIPLSILKTIIKSKPREINIEQVSDSRLRILYDNRNIEFTSHSVDDFPFPPDSGFIDIGTWDKAMITMLHSMTLFCSDDIQRPSLCGVNISLNGSMTNIATDGHILKKVTLGGEFKEFDAILPKRLLQILPQIVKRQAMVSMSDEFLKLVIDSDIEIIAKPIDGVFPNVDRVMPHEFAHHVTLNRKDLIELLIDASAFSDNATMQAVLLFRETGMSVQVNNHKRSISWQADMPYAGEMPENYKVGINILYAIKVLKDIIDDTMSWKFNDPSSAMVLHGVGVEKEILLLMPVRIKEESDE